MQKIKHKKISSLQMDDVIVNVYKNFVHIIDTTDLSQIFHLICYNGESIEFYESEQAINFLNSIPE